MTLILLFGFALLFIVGVALLFTRFKIAGIILLAVSAVVLLVNLAFAFLIMSSDM